MNLLLPILLDGVVACYPDGLMAGMA